MLWQLAHAVHPSLAEGGYYQQAGTLHPQRSCQRSLRDLLLFALEGLGERWRSRPKNCIESAAASNAGHAKCSTTPRPARASSRTTGAHSTGGRDFGLSDPEQNRVATPSEVELRRSQDLGCALSSCGPRRAEELRRARHLARSAKGSASQARAMGTRPDWRVDRGGSHACSSTKLYPMSDDGGNDARTLRRESQA